MGTLLLITTAFFLSILSYFDIKAQKVSDSAVYFYIVIGIAINFLTSGWLGFFDSIVSIIFYLIFGVFVFGKGLGGGDIKVFMMIGCFFGIEKSFFMILLSLLIKTLCMLILPKAKINSNKAFLPYVFVSNLLFLIWNLHFPHINLVI